MAPYHVSTSACAQQPKIIGPAVTVCFESKIAASRDTTSSVPEQRDTVKQPHWVESTRPDTVVVIEQPEDQRCAVLGGIMAARMKFLGAKAVVVGGSGRVRDITELKRLGLPVVYQKTLV